jgi:hypothetical protein
MAHVNGAVDIGACEYQPVVTRIGPATGPASGGTVVTITGMDLTGATAVYFGTATPSGGPAGGSSSAAGAAAGGTRATSVVVDSATQITATSPAEAAGTVDVTVVSPIGTSASSAADQFTYYSTTLTVTPADWAAAGLTLTLDSDGNLHVYRTGTTIDAVAPCPAADVTNIAITAPSGAAANLTIDSTNGNPIPAGGLDYSGAGGLIETGSGRAVLAGVLQVDDAAALPDGGNLTVGAGAAFGQGRGLGRWRRLAWCLRTKELPSPPAPLPSTGEGSHAPSPLPLSPPWSRARGVVLPSHTCPYEHRRSAATG